MLDDFLHDQALHLQLDLAARNAGDIEQIVDQAREMRGLPLQHSAHMAHRGRLIRPAAENRRDVEDRCQRVAQLVRKHREEFVLAPVGLQQPRLALQKLAMRDLQVMQELDERGTDQHEERDVRQPADRVAPGEVVVKQGRSDCRGRQ